MLNRKLISFMLAIMMLFSMTFAYAEEFVQTPEETIVDAAFGEIPEVLYYSGGVVARGYLKDAATVADSELLQLGYVLTDMPYIVIGQPTTWEIYISGGTGSYECRAMLAYQEDLSMDPFANGWAVLDYFEIDGETFDYTFTENGRYFWQFEVEDSAGQCFSFQTRIYEAYTEADETDSSTTVGKVNSIVNELITDSMSDYTRARVLHDWIIYNANYDYTYTNYDASGVLLYGSGVCDSYARAYLMLCTAAGLECVYVSGTAGSDPNPNYWGDHGWNLVKLGNSWYHVDCTWDDPGTGGYENHSYFCVDDETMAKDHRWNQPDDIFDNGGMIVPDAEGGEYEAGDLSERDYDFTFTTWREYFEKFDAMVANGERRATTTGLYTGNDDVWDVYSEMAGWVNDKTTELAGKWLITGAGYSFYGNFFSVLFEWFEPSSYMRIAETELRLSVGESAVIIPEEIEPWEDIFTWTSSDPDVANVSYVFDENDDVAVTIHGVSGGDAIITVTSPDGLSDTIKVTVMQPYAPEFGLEFVQSSAGLKLTWDGIPGVTEYQVWYRLGSSNTLVDVTVDNEIVLDEELLIPDLPQQFYVVANRRVAGRVVMSYTSGMMNYGVLDVVFTSYLPFDTRTIEAEAFAGVSSLTALNIRDGVECIGRGAFSGCTGLEIISIPASVTSIGADAFANCTVKYALVDEGSYADLWLAANCSSVIRIYP